MKNKLEPILFIPDTHVPYHDKKAFALMLKVAAFLKPKHIVIQGDFADFYSVSSHSKDPTRANSLEEESAEVNLALDQIDKLGAPNKIYVEGNHEDRLNRFLQDKAPALYSSLRVEKSFRLKERGWKFTPYKDHTKLGCIYLTHDTGKAGPTAHADALNDFQDNVLIGHTHRMAYTIRGNAKGVPHVAAMFGWLGDISKVDYMHKVKAMKDWALGFGIGYLEPSTGHVFVVPIPIVEYGCVVNGKKFEVR